MKVLVVGVDYPESFGRYIRQGFESLGDDVALLEPAPKALSQGPGLGHGGARLRTALRTVLQQSPFFHRWLEQRLLTAAAMKRPDLVVCGYDYLLPRTVERLKEVTKARVALWFPDAIANFGRHAFLNAPFDALFFKDPFIVAQLRRTIAVPVFYLPEAFDPKSLPPIEPSPADLARYGCDITTACNIYPYRIEFFAQLTDYHVKIWGNVPPRWALADRIAPMVMDHFVSGQEKARAFRSAKIVLNNLHPSEVWGVNVRAFEAAGVGAFQMIDWRPGLSQLFEPNREIVAFSDLKDLRTKLDKYLADEDARREVAAAGQRRARKEHTYSHRLALMQATMFGDASGHPMPSVDWGERKI